MSDLGSSALDGPANDIFKVTPLDRDASRNAGHGFAQFGEEEDKEKEGSAEPEKDQSPAPSSPKADILDDVLLSEVARRAVEDQQGPESEQGSGGQPPPESRKPIPDYEHPGSIVDLKA